MSSTKPASLIAAAALCALTAAGASPQTERASADPLPTEHFKPKVEVRSERLLLTPHPDGLSPAQRAAPTDLVGRWRSAPGGGQAVTVGPERAPGNGATAPDAGAVGAGPFVFMECVCFLSGARKVCRSVGCQ